MSSYTVTIKIPPRLDAILALPVLLYRRLRYGYTYRRIKLTKGYYAKVDPDDFERLNQHKWQAAEKDGACYAIRTIFKNKKRTLLHMHREVINAPPGTIVDHINRDGKDNRKANLRLANKNQNVWNSKRGKNTGKSKYKGVHWDNRVKKWRTRLVVNRRDVFSKYFDDEIQAAKAYDEVAKKYRGEFAMLNFPDKPSKLRRVRNAIRLSWLYARRWPVTLLRLVTGRSKHESNCPSSQS